MSGSKRTTSFFCALGLIGLGALNLHAQTKIDRNATSNIVTDTTWTGFTYVGSNSDGNTLNIYNSATLWSTTDAIVGNNNVSSSNIVNITDGGKWRISGSLQMGTSNNFRNIVHVDGSAKDLSNHAWFTNPELSADLVNSLTTDTDITALYIQNGIQKGGDNTEDNQVQVYKNGFLIWGGSATNSSFIQNEQSQLISLDGEFSMEGGNDLDNCGITLTGATTDLADADYNIGRTIGSANLRILNGTNTSFKGDLTLGAGSGSDSFIVVAKAKMDVLGDIHLGGNWKDKENSDAWTPGSGINNIIWLNDGRIVASNGFYNTSLDTESGIKMKNESLIEAGIYQQSSTAFLDVDVPTNFAISTITSGTAEFQAGTRINFISTENEHLPFGKIYTTNFVTTGNLSIESEDGLSAGDATTEDVQQIDTSGSQFLHADLSVSNALILSMPVQIMRVEFSRQYMSESAGIAQSSGLAKAINEADEIARGADATWTPIAQGMSSNLFDNYTPNQQAKILTQIYGESAPTFMHGKSINDGIAQVMGRSSSFHMMAAERKEKEASTGGAPGPHTADQGAQGWILGYGNFGDYEVDTQATSASSMGYDQQVYGSVLGIDYAVNNLLLGVAGGMAGSSLETKEGDTSDADTQYGMLYASYGSKEWFADAVVSMGQMSIENSSGTGLVGTSSDVDASQLSMYFAVGKEWRLQNKGAYEKSWRWRPHVGFRYSNYDQDPYTETSTTALPKVVDGYDRDSYQTDLGAAIVFPKAYKGFGLEHELRAYWLHELESDSQKVAYTLQGGSSEHYLTMQGPDKDALDAGYSIKAVLTNGFQARASVDMQLSDNLMQTRLTGSLLYKF